MTAPPTEYPTWICHACGLKYGRGPEPSDATYHEDTCDICGTVAPCTQPRDFGHLREGWRDDPCRKFVDIARKALGDGV